MFTVQKFCEKCGLDYHGVSAMNCKADSPNIGTPAWRQGRSQVMENIKFRQKKLREYIINTDGEERLREMQRHSAEMLNLATYGMETTDDPGW